MGLSEPIFQKSPTFFPKTLDKPVKKCGASRPLINKYIFLIGGDF